MQAQLPNQLPIARHAQEITQLIQKHSVVVLSGKTGCGKSTQVPQYILKSLPTSKIAICQPRRVAATSLAVRVSQELNCKLGSQVGYHVGMQAFREQNCSIVYMTYGILIQQLLFKSSIAFTHIILDEIHQRSLEMDFTFVALKNIINGKYKDKIKLIIMSATLNASEFANYFSTDSQGLFYVAELRPIVRTRQEKQHRGRQRNRECSKKYDDYQLVAMTSEYNAAPKFQLQQERNFKVDQWYLDDLDGKKDYYSGQFDDEQRITEELFTFAVQLYLKLKKQLGYSAGDFLIFLPGLFEIQSMKNRLITEGIQSSQIIEVHSLFSEELYFKLFNSQVQSKVILATNMGESSITLPFCKVVIDFCLSRRNHTKNKGVSRLETHLASQASLTQRAGRVGRVSDGVVYRLITRQLYSQLPQYQRPQIQCVSLEMVILKSKQMDITNKSDLFCNPFYFLMNTLNPPSLDDISQALASLIEQDALVDETSGSGKIEQCHKLYLTQVGHFMVSMPCDLQVSKMMLMGIKLGIPGQMIRIASVLMSTKPFFLHEERRYCIESYMHAIIGYDRARFNDYLLREELYSHWKEQFYEKARRKKVYTQKYSYNELDIEKIGFKTYNNKRVYNNDDQAESLTFLEQFNQEKWSQLEKEWCSERGVSPNTMREILKIEQSIKFKLLNFDLRVEKQKISNLLVLLCLDYGFPGNDCQVVWKDNMSSDQYFISLPNSFETHDDLIEDYLRPLRQYTVQEGKTKKVYGGPSIMSKFLLPIHYSKGNTKNASSLFCLLNQKKMENRFSSDVFHRRRPVTVLNESINKVCIPLEPSHKYALLTHKFTEIGTRKMINMCALVEQGRLHLMHLITKKEVKVGMHPSQSYYSKFKIQESSYNFTTVIGNDQVRIINEMRKLARRQKNSKVSSADEQMTVEDIDILERVLTNTQDKSYQLEKWETLFFIDRQTQYEETYFDIETAPALHQDSHFFTQYTQWKTNKYYSFLKAYRPLVMQNCFLICKQCSPTQIVEIQMLSSYQHDTAVLRLNQYSGSWVIPKVKGLNNSQILCCKNQHKIGSVLNEDEAAMMKDMLKIYVPYNRIYDLWEDWPSAEEIAAKLSRGLTELAEVKDNISHFQCGFCFSIAEDTGEPIRKQFSKPQLRHQFWKKIMEHLRSKQHLANLTEFRRGILKK